MRRKLEWSGGVVKGSGVKRVGKGGHQRALRTLNRRHMICTTSVQIRFSQTQVQYVIIQKYFLNNLLLHKLSQSSQLQ